MLNLELSQILIQIIAFLVMLWVMKRYGWKPLLDVLEGRQKKIHDEFDSIAAQKEEVKQLMVQYEEKLKEVESNMRKKIQEAVAKGNKISVEIQEDAQAKAKEIVEKAKSEVKEEIVKAKNQLKDDMVNLVMDTTKKILQENLDTESQKKLIAKFVEEVHLK